jgi:hypothetical protein
MKTTLAKNASWPELDPLREAHDQLIDQKQKRFKAARNDTLEEVAKEFEKMHVLGDTAASFAAFVRGMKK